MHLVEYDVQAPGMYVGGHSGLELLSEGQITGGHERQERAAAAAGQAQALKLQGSGCHEAAA